MARIEPRPGDVCAIETPGGGFGSKQSKRTDLHGVYACIRNKNGAGYTVGSAIEGGSGNRGLNLGIRHIF